MECLAWRQCRQIFGTGFTDNVSNTDSRPNSCQVDSWIRECEKAGVVRQLAQAMVKAVKTPAEQKVSWPPNIGCSRATKTVIFEKAHDVVMRQRAVYKHLLPFGPSDLKVSVMHSSFSIHEFTSLT